MFALYSGSVADPGDCNPYNGESLILAKLWMRGYMRMKRVRIDTGPAMQTYFAARAWAPDDNAIDAPAALEWLAGRIGYR